MNSIHLTSKNAKNKITNKTVPIVITIPSKPKEYQSTPAIITLIGKINNNNFFIS